jgi:hypothetical protein
VGVIIIPNAIKEKNTLSVLKPKKKKNYTEIVEKVILRLYLINFRFNTLPLFYTSNSLTYKMLNIFKNKQNGLNDKSLSTNYITEKNIKTQSNSQRDEYNNIIFYPSSSKE